MVGLTRANLRRAVGGVGLLAAISVAILGAGSASAATIVNGDFETGKSNWSRPSNRLKKNRSSQKISSFGSM